jgi:signal transduction histidine kinase
LSLNARNLIWALDPQHDSLYDLVLHVQRFGEQLFEDSDIGFSIEGLSGDFENIRMPMIDRREIALIVKEALHNVLRHSKAHHVTLAIRYRESFFEIAVEDDGVGIPESLQTYGNGLANMNVRTQRLKGELSVEAGDAHGTRVQLRVPIGRAL